MKNLRVFLDLDGVLVDFRTGAFKAHGVEIPEEWPVGDDDFEKIIGVSRNQFWKKLNNSDFWANLKWMPDGQEILALVESLIPKEDICILSSPSISPSCAKGKMMWIQKNIPEYSKRVLLGNCKYMCAAPEHILIDDSDHKLDKFHEYGGVTITVPRPWNRYYGIATDTVKYISTSLEVIKDDYYAPRYK